MMQYREIIERRFGDAALREDAEAAVERGFYDALLLEYVGKRPVTHHFGEAVALANGVGEKWAHVGAVCHLRLIAVVGIVFGPDERHVWIGRGGDLLMHFVYGAAHHFVARNVFVRAEDVFRFVVSVDVRGDKIYGDVLFFAVL